MNRFTPGGWHVEEKDILSRAATIATPIRIYSDDPGRHLPFTVAVVEGCAGWNGDAGQANARLIAAAPDMYEALKLILENYKANGGKGLGVHPIAKAKAALAKAEGRDE